MKPAILRTFGALALVLVVNGCAMRGGRPAFSPDLFEIVPLIDPVVDLPGMQREFSGLFPDDVALTANGEMTIRRRWAPGTEALRMRYAAAGPDRVRLQGSRQLATIFELLAADGRLTMRFNGDRPVGFAGSSAPGASPLLEAWGIDPGDIWRLLRIGQRIGQGEWAADRGWGKVTLTPLQYNAAEGLERIVLDGKTRLPREARWRRGGESWTVRYDKWALFGEERRLVPEAIEILPSRPRVTIKLDFSDKSQGRFSFLAAAPPAMFAPIDLGTIEVFSLEDLAKVLSEL